MTQQYLQQIRDRLDEELQAVNINIEHDDFEEWLEIQRT